FFQAEDGIRYKLVTGVQTCALPIYTNLDTYERIYEEDVREGAVEIASAAYATAMADQMVPRFKDSEMPKPVPEPGPGSQATKVRSEERRVGKGGRGRRAPAR